MALSVGGTQTIDEMLKYAPKFNTGSDAQTWLSGQAKQTGNAAMQDLLKSAPSFSQGTDMTVWLKNQSTQAANSATLKANDAIKSALANNIPSVATPAATTTDDARTKLQANLGAQINEGINTAISQVNPFMTGQRSATIQQNVLKPAVQTLANYDVEKAKTDAATALVNKKEQLNSLLPLVQQGNAEAAAAYKQLYSDVYGANATTTGTPTGSNIADILTSNAQTGTSGTTISTKHANQLKSAAAGVSGAKAKRLSDALGNLHGYEGAGDWLNNIWNEYDSLANVASNDAWENEDQVKRYTALANFLTNMPVGDFNNANTWRQIKSAAQQAGVDASSIDKWLQISSALNRG